MLRDLNHKDPFQEVLTEAATRAYNYLQTIQERHVGVLQEAIENLPSLGGPMPAHGEDPRAVIQLLDEIGSPATMASMGPRMFGGVIGGAFPATVAAHWLADAWDQNACLFDFAPVAAYLEDVVLCWLLDLFGLPATSGGAFETGTQMANGGQDFAIGWNEVIVRRSPNDLGLRNRGTPLPAVKEEAISHADRHLIEHGLVAHPVPTKGNIVRG